MKKEYSYRPSGVCSAQMDVTINDGIITDVKIIGGCSGNSQGVARLVVGMKAEDAISKIEGIHCGYKQTSCPDQLAKAIELCLSK